MPKGTIPKMANEEWTLRFPDGGVGRIVVASERPEYWDEQQAAELETQMLRIFRTDAFEAVLALALEQMPREGVRTNRDAARSLIRTLLYLLDSKTEIRRE